MEKQKIINKITDLKKKHNAVIIAHNYQRPEIQDIADVLGDSLELSRIAAGTDAGVIVFCGVRFMAETAAILSPDKQVLMPDPDAGCSLADMVTVDRLRQLKEKHPRAVVVAYVNTSAEVKAEADICCTSANAAAVVKAVKETRPFGPNRDEIIFIPDQNLGHYASSQTGNPLIIWDGFCAVHTVISTGDIDKARRLYPQAKIIVHGECRPEVAAKADIVGSTAGMCKFAKESSAREFVIGTETDFIYRLAKDNPGKKFYPLSESSICYDMKKITLKKVLYSLEHLQYRITIPEDIRCRAKQAVDKMLEVV